MEDKKMEIKIKKGKEFTKGMLAGKNVKLTIEINVCPSEEEKSLIQKYHDPSINFFDLKGYFSSEEAFKVVKLDNENVSLSKYKILAHIDDGLHYLSNIEKLKEAVTAELGHKLDYLKSLDQWEGEEIV
jgi:hypothetical protein